MRKQLVVARYNEDLSWLEKVDIPTVVYNKGPDNISFERPDIRIKKLYNVGREAHTYLWHILNQWEVIPDYTIFTQGDPFPHSPDFVERIRKDYPDTQSLTTQHLPHHPGKYITDLDHVETVQGFEVRYGIINHFNEMPYYFNIQWFDLLWSRLFHSEDKPDRPTFGYAGIYSVPRHRIVFRPWSFYRYIFHETERYPVLLNAYALESLWLYIWGDGLKYREVNRYGVAPLPPDHPKFLDPVNFKRRSFFPKSMA